MGLLDGPAQALPSEPLSDTCPEPPKGPELTLSADEVLVYAPVSGQWTVASLVTHESAAHHAAPCATSWVRVLSEGHGPHARLSDLPEGTRIAYAGRLLRTGEGTVQPTGEVLSRVVDTFSRTAEGVFGLEVALPDGTLTWLSATAEHPFYAVEAGKYLSVRHLEVGSRLHVEGGGDALLVSKTRRQGGVEVFNVEVAGEHNYFAAGVLTHNPDGCAPRRAASIGTRDSVRRSRSRCS